MGLKPQFLPKACLNYGIAFQKTASGYQYTATQNKTKLLANHKAMETRATGAKCGKTQIKNRVLRFDAGCLEKHLFFLLWKARYTDCEVLQLAMDLKNVEISW